MKLNTEGSAQKAMLAPLKNFPLSSTYIWHYLNPYFLPNSCHSLKSKYSLNLHRTVYLFLVIQTSLTHKANLHNGRPNAKFGFVQYQDSGWSNLFSGLAKAIFSKILFKITTAKLTVSQVSAFQIIKSEFTECIFLFEGCFFDQPFFLYRKST